MMSSADEEANALNHSASSQMASVGLGANFRTRVATIKIVNLICIVFPDQFEQVFRQNDQEREKV
jgi:hypothetical protein